LVEAAGGCTGFFGESVFVNSCFAATPIGRLIVPRQRVTIRQLASEAGLEVDEALITLWDSGFPHVNAPSDWLRDSEANRARRALGLATRREMASPSYWSAMFQVPEGEIGRLLGSLGVSRPSDGGRLTKKAILRLRSEANSRRAGSAEVADVRYDSTPTVAPLVWSSIGHVKELRYLSVDDVRTIHQALVDDFAADADPITPAGIKSHSLLGSAVSRPLTSIDGELKYPTVEMAGAALLHAIVHDHPFHNGNKRTGLVSMVVFLDENGLTLTCDQDALFKLVLQLAQHALVTGPRHELADREVMAVAIWITNNVRWLEKGDRPIPWRRLRRILSAYHCSFEAPGKNRIDIVRTITKPGGLFKRGSTQTLRTQLNFADDGREVEMRTVKKIRHDLQLDEYHSVDSLAFYDNVPMSPGDFIVRYRKTLTRLARL
jgi:death-on-curing family protein